MAWQITYSFHLLERIKIRGLPIDLAKDILLFATERYYDKITHNLIAIASKKYRGKIREFVVVYEENWEADIINIITAHPLKPGQKNNRIHSGRWVKR